MHELLRVCLLLFLLPNLICGAHCGELGGSDGESKSSISSETGAATTSNSITVAAAVSVTGTLGNATCLSRTANYITHTLPQQCLRTDRVAANATQSVTSLEAQSANATSNSNASVPTSSSDGHTPSPSVTNSALNSPTSETPSAETRSAASPESEAESDSPLDNANFLSFEEWKKQNLAKSGQSPENVGNGRNIEGIRERPINNALESYGDEEEIDLDFSGFGGKASTARASRRESQTGVTVDAPTGELVPALRSKDAGKTCKERTNYASFDCAANVLKSNPECKSSSAVLVENKDSYMLNTCSANNKFFIIELCDDILIDTIVLANYEFFSSMFRHFRVSVSDRYPVKIERWKDLGTFEARNVRDVQAFLVERPQIWTRYLRIEFLSHYGSEYYCPVSLLRVHGTTMLEDYRHQEEIARGDHSEEATLDVDVNATPALAQEPTTSTDEAAKETVTAIQSVDTSQNLSSSAISPPQRVDTNSSKTAEPAPTSAPPNATMLLSNMLLSLSDNSTCALDVSTNAMTSAGPHDASDVSTSTNSSSTDVHIPSTSGSESVLTAISETKPTMRTSDATSAPVNETSQHKGTSSAPSTARNAGDGSSGSSASSSSASSSSSQVAAISSASTLPESSTSSSSTDSMRHPTSSTVAAPPQAATQESFYKSVHKRLQKLESNSTLSLQYIEEQSRILRDAFSKVEKRQIASTSSFLTNLNTTVMAELQGFRQAYDQLWQSTVIELEGQREQYQREMLAMGSRLTLVADELVWQKRMGIVQSTLLLLCLGLVLFARQGNGHLEMPLMQQMVHRSQTALARAGWESPLDSPSPISRSPVSLFRRKLWRSHTEPASGNITDATDSRPQSKDGPGPEVVVAPPTPPRGDGDGGGVGSAGVEEDDTADVDEEAFEDVWESRSGPSTPRGTREGMSSASNIEQGVGWLDPGASVDGVEGR